MNICPETTPIILGHEPAASNALLDTSKPINLENCKGVLIIVTEYTAGGDTDLALTVHEGATAALATAGATPIAKTFPIWVCTDGVTTDAMVRQTDAVGYTIDATPTTNHVVAMYISSSILTEGRPWICLGAAGGNAANIVSVLYILDGARYQQTTPPTAFA